MGFGGIRGKLHAFIDVCVSPTDLSQFYPGPLPSEPPRNPPSPLNPKQGKVQGPYNNKNLWLHKDYIEIKGTEN